MREWEEKDHRTKIMNMFYDWTQEREIMYKIQNQLTYTTDLFVAESLVGLTDVSEVKIQ